METECEVIQLHISEVVTMCCRKVFKRDEKEWIVDCEGGKWCPECVPFELYQMLNEACFLQAKIDILEGLLKKANLYTPYFLAEEIDKVIK